MRYSLMDYEQIEASAKQKKRLRTLFTDFVLVLWAVIVLFPFYWMLLTSVKSYGSYNSEFIPRLFPLSPTLENYGSAFSQVPLGRYFLNTLVFTVITTALMLFVTVLAAFAFSRLRFRMDTELLRKLFGVLLLATGVKELLYHAN